MESEEKENVCVASPVQSCGGLLVGSPMFRATQNLIHYAGMVSLLTIHGTPNLSFSIPKRVAHAVC